MLRQGALFALFMAFLSALAAYQAYAEMRGARTLYRAAGRVTFARTDVRIYGTKFAVFSEEREFHLDHLPILFEYQSRWPDFRRIERAIRDGAELTVLYGNCHPIIKTRACNAYGIETGAGQTLATVDEVVDAERSLLIFWSMIATILLLISAGCIFAYLRATMPLSDT